MHRNLLKPVQTPVYQHRAESLTKKYSVQSYRTTGAIIRARADAGAIDVLGNTRRVHPTHPEPGSKSRMKQRHPALVAPIAVVVPLMFGLIGAQSASSTAATTTAVPAELTDGKVRKIDLDNQKITLKHSLLKNLDMPGMTMVFRIQDVALFDTVQAGDKVRFTAEKIDGKFTVTKIEKAQ